MYFKGLLMLIAFIIIGVDSQIKFCRKTKQIDNKTVCVKCGFATKLTEGLCIEHKCLVEKKFKCQVCSPRYLLFGAECITRKEYKIRSKSTNDTQSNQKDKNCKVFKKNTCMKCIPKFIFNQDTRLCQESICKFSFSGKCVYCRRGYVLRKKKCILKKKKQKSKQKKTKQDQK